MNTNYHYDWQQGDTSLHSVQGQVHAGPHSIPAHSDNGQQFNDESGAFVSAGTAGQQGFDVRTLGLTEQELQATGLHPSLIGHGHQLPLDQYKINYDPNPIIIRKQIPIEMPTYKQQVIVRYLRPPTPPSPGPLIVKEVREPQPAPAPPLVIRTRAPRERTPPPIIIREAPPHAPQFDPHPQYFTRVIRHDEPSFAGPDQYQSMNYDQQQFNGAQQGHHFQQQQNEQQFGGGQSNAWVTELISDNGTSSAAPPHLLDDIYRAFNNQLPRI